MSISDIDIALIRQEPKSNDSLRACSLMLFNYYQDKSATQYIWKKMHIYEKHSGLSGAYLQDLGLLSLKNNYDAQINFYDWQWWNKNCVESVEKGKKALIKALNELKTGKEWADKKIINKEIKFLKDGGIFKFEVPNLSTIDFFIAQKEPVILIVRGEDFYKNPQENYNHSILVFSKVNDNYLIRDPLYAVEEIQANYLLPAWTRAGGWMIAVKPSQNSKGFKQNRLI